MIFAFSYYLVSFIVSLISPFWGLVGFVCSLLLRFQDRVPEITMIKPFILLLFGLTLGCVINRDKLAKLAFPQDKLLIALLCISIFGLLLLSPGSLLNETYLFICSLSLYYFASRILQTPLQILTVFFFMGLSITYLGYEAIEAVGLDPKNSPYIDPRSGRWQGIGYYENSNEFGQLMITTIPFLLATLFIKINPLIKLASVAMMSLMLFVMIKCESRTVMITLSLMVVGTIMLRGKGNIIKKGIIGGIMMGVMLTVLTFMPGPIQDRMETVLDAGNDESFQGRTRAWEYGFDMLSWYPITGVGKNQWMEYHGLMPHNSYVQIMAELGFFGIIVFLWILIRCFKNFKPILNTQEDKLPEPSEYEGEYNLFKDSSEISDSGSYYGLENTRSIDIERSSETKEVELEPIDNTSKTISIAVLITFCGWLLYIFLGNQGYSVWTYFYIGICASLCNFIPNLVITPEQRSFDDLLEVKS